VVPRSVPVAEETTDSIDVPQLYNADVAELEGEGVSRFAAD